LSNDGRRKDSESSECLVEIHPDEVDVINRRALWTLQEMKQMLDTANTMQKTSEFNNSMEGLQPDFTV
jgi:hypothetical protein